MKDEHPFSILLQLAGAISRCRCNWFFILIENCFVVQLSVNASNVNFAFEAS